MPGQSRPTSQPDEVKHVEPQNQTRLSPPDQSSLRITRSQSAQTKCLELASLRERDLYALPTEGDGEFPAIEPLLLHTGWPNCVNIANFMCYLSF